MTLVAAVGRACLLDVSRRRGVIVLLALLPLVFYLLRRDQEGQSIRMLALGFGWAVSTVALFAAVAAKGVDLRLRLSGYAAWHLVAGRALAITVCGLSLAGLYGVLVAVDQNVDRPWAVILLLVTTALVAAPLGAVFGALLPRDLEGTLALLAVFAMQMLTDPGDHLAKILPYWSTREIGTFAIDGTGSDDLARGLAHFAGTWVLLMAAAVTVSTIRLRLARFPVPRAGRPGPSR